CALYHQEHYDGRGYPEGLAGSAIPIEARIVAVADTFDAMTTDRPYRAALPTSDAIAEIQRCAGTQFDPDVVAAFLRAIARGTIAAARPSPPPRPRFSTRRGYPESSLPCDPVHTARAGCRTAPPGDPA